MNKKLIVILTVIIIVLGAYGSYYAYATTYLMPKDIELLKDEIKTINESGTYDEEISSLERQADRIENLSLLNSIPLSERQKQANDLENGRGIQSINNTLNELKQNITATKNMALEYDLLLMGDIASGLKSAYSDEIVDTLNSMDPLMSKLAQDLRSGDNKAVADDLRKLADALRTFNKQEQISADNLQDAVNKLEAKKQGIFF
ncbi:MULTISPECIES: hypothetical protein [Methanobacterium]|uniref:Uncharacterized protein n=1 Tax=Methanobacterium bryantii TaxID=2161 RepID=A0A2A2H978_METBR|nr:MULTISPECIES: hypothetical protein [Methanobacterium]OEC86854.1 hypothetical protein A9507_07995 [Methanobacterium sp. A39]PAV05915.1 hypothetical protein ASJ80_13735 [Methanobacterium bryantii]